MKLQNFGANLFLNVFGKMIFFFWIFFLKLFTNTNIFIHVYKAVTDIQIIIVLMVLFNTGTWRLSLSLR